MVNILYQCEICKTMYPKKIEAEKCESLGIKTPKFKVGDRVMATCSDGKGEFESEVIWVFAGHNRVDYNVRALDRERFIRGGGFTRYEDELAKVEE